METTNVNIFIFQKIFLKHGYSIEETDDEEYTSLHYTSLIGNLPIVQYLIDKGANIESTDNEQYTPQVLEADSTNMDAHLMKLTNVEDHVCILLP